MIDFAVQVSDEQWNKANDKEKAVLAKIRQCNKWWSNFELNHNEERDYIFSMIMQAQHFNGYIKAFFKSDLGCFCFRLEPEMTEVRDLDTNEIIPDINPISSLDLAAYQLVFFYQVCEMLDGLLPGYYVRGDK